MDRIGFYDIEDFAHNITKSKMFGGRSESVFDDYPSVIGIRSVIIHVGDQVDSIEVTYRLADGDTRQSGRHGGDGGSKYSFNLAEGDYISWIEGKTNGELVDQLTFTVTEDNGSILSHMVHMERQETHLSPCKDNFISSLSLVYSSGSLLDSIGFYSYNNLSKSELFGGVYGGSRFDSNPNSPQSALTGPSLKTSMLLIRSGNRGDSIQAEYVAFGGKFILSPTFGGTGGSLHVVDVGADEVIIKMEGKTNGMLIDQLTFTMKNTKGETRTAGLFGKTGKTHSQSLLPMVSRASSVELVIC